MPSDEAGTLVEVGLTGESSSRRVLQQPPKTALAVTVIGIVFLLDVLTKAWIVRNFSLYESTQIVGDWIRLTYTHNRGAAFGIHVGEYSRVFFLGLSLVALVVLGLIFRATPAEDRVRLRALALVAGGAIGNILNRIQYERGVVDFLDVGIGTHRWPVFNVADMAVSTGAILLLISFYVEGRREDRRAEESGEEAE